MAYVKPAKLRKQANAREKAGLGTRDLQFDFAKPNAGLHTNPVSSSGLVSNSSNKIIKDRVLSKNQEIDPGSVLVKPKPANGQSEYMSEISRVRRMNADPIHFNRDSVLGDTITNAYKKYDGLVNKDLLNDFRKNADPSKYTGKRKSEIVGKINSDIEGLEINRRVQSNTNGPVSGAEAEKIHKSAVASFNRDKQAAASTTLSSRETAGVGKGNSADGIFDPGISDEIKSGLNPAQKYSMNKAINKYSSVEQMVNKGGMNDIVKKQMGFKEDSELSNFLKMNGADRNKQYQQGINKSIENPGMLNAAMGYKVPHMAMGALGTAGLVSAMSSNKGQQTNAQLYGQQQPYY